MQRRFVHAQALDPTVTLTGLCWRRIAFERRTCLRARSAPTGVAALLLGLLLVETAEKSRFKSTEPVIPPGPAEVYCHIKVGRLADQRIVPAVIGSSLDKIKAIQINFAAIDNNAVPLEWWYKNARAIALVSAGKDYRRDRCGRDRQTQRED